MKRNSFFGVITRLIFSSVGVYLVAWFVTYSIFMQFDYSYFFSYFVKSWHGGLEIPSFIQLISFAATLIFICIACIWLVVKRQRDRVHLIE